MTENRSPSVGRFRMVSRGREHTLEDSSIHAPYGLEILDSCITCPHHEARLFCNLGPAVLQRLSEITSASSYPKGATLFVEGQSARGVHIVCSGRVKLSTASIDGKTLIARIAEPGEVLGLPGTVTGKPYELTADVSEPSQLKFVARQDFLNLIRDYGEVGLRVAQLLGETYHTALTEMRTIGLSNSARKKLAHFILDWTAHHSSAKGPAKPKLTLTHGEIAQVIGATRETVTRVFVEFKKKNLVIFKGSTLTIKDRAGLERILQGP
jgi:CRP/FNR family cyclic AMP-dependent transcriptional regulator